MSNGTSSVIRAGGNAGQTCAQLMALAIGDCLGCWMLQLPACNLQLTTKKQSHRSRVRATKTSRRNHDFRCGYLRGVKIEN